MLSVFPTSLLSKSLRDVHTLLCNIQIASISWHINLSTLVCPPPIQDMNCRTSIQILHYLLNQSESLVCYALVCLNISVRHGRSSVLHLLCGLCEITNIGLNLCACTQFFITTIQYVYLLYQCISYQIHNHAINLVLSVA